MYIEPNSIIKIYHNVPLDETYNHTIYYQSISTQNNYFHNTPEILRYTLTNQSYQRINRGVMRIEKSADDLYGCNYIAFQNTSYGNKWFYAFIKTIEYVNNITSEITFDIDVMQTYYFDVELKDCFIERQHTESDGIGEHLLAEGVNCSTYLTNKEYVYDLDDGEFLFVLCATQGLAVKGESLFVNPGWYGKMYSGIYVYAIDLTTDTGRNRVQNLLEAFAPISSAVINCYICPRWFIRCNASNNYFYETHFGFTADMSLDGYTPKNNKLYTYPYNKLVATNNAGQKTEYAFEYFTRNYATTPTAQFTINGVRLPKAECICYPDQYKGIANNYDMCLTLNEFPSVQWASDYYKLWWNNNQYKLTASLENQQTSFLASALNSTIGYFTGRSGTAYNQMQNNNNPLVSAGSGVIGGAVSYSNAINSQIAEIDSAKATPDICNGNMTNDYINNFLYKKYAYTFRQQCLPAEVLKSIDDYFSMFGYKINKIGVPNRSARPHWTFVKTNGCVVDGNAPADDVATICAIYDKGITFWNWENEVGDYSLDNRPV